MSTSRNLENNIVKIIAAIGFLAISFFAIQIFSGVYTNKLAKNFSQSNTLESQISQEIASETDPYQLVKLGASFSKSQNNDLALQAFQRATELDEKYRDAWVLRGYQELKMDQISQAIESLKKAEAIDPINPRTYELLAIAYSQADNADAAKKAKEKYDYLQKSSN